MSVLLDKIKTGFKNPWRFIGRQIYRLVVILPLEAIVWLYEKLPHSPLPAGGEGACFIISSVVFCKPAPLTYSVTRSVYSPEDRAKQTIDTITSIRNKVPGATIILVEAGLKKELPFGVASLVDSYVYVGDRTLVRKACDSKFKSLGEVVLLLAAYKQIPNKKDYFKISGRYFLTDDFDLKTWLQGECKLHFIRPDFVSTRLYSFTQALRRTWYFALIKSLPYLFLDYPIEYTLARFMPREKVTMINVVGVAGSDATSGSKVQE